MSTLRRLIPDPGLVDPAGLRLRTLPPFSPQAADFLHSLSERLMADPEARGRGDLTALAFALRRSASRDVLDHVRKTLPADCAAVPRGTVLLIPPVNVDVLFVHCWRLALLCGCAAIIRVPAASGANLLLDHIAALLDDPVHAQVRASVVFVAWGREPEIGAALSELCDLRMVWGGDATVSDIRKLPLPPRAMERSFADRVSAAAASAAHYLSCNDAARDAALRDFIADSFTFDQAACSSPRLLAWVGTEQDCAAAQADFLTRLAVAAPSPEPGAALAKWTEAARMALDGTASNVRLCGGALVVEAERAAAGECGGGLFVQIRLDRPADLAEQLDGRWQSLSYFGISAGDLAELAAALNGKALDRVVPWGKALEFGPVWDGVDLTRDFLKLVSGVQTL